MVLPIEDGDVSVANNRMFLISLMAVLGLNSPFGTTLVPPNDVVSELMLSKGEHRYLIEKNKSRLKTRMNVLANLKSGWNNDKNTKAIDPFALQNVNAILISCPDVLLEGWNLYPCANGSLILDYAHDEVEASVNVTSNKMSGFWELDGKCRTFDDKLFDVEAIRVYLGDVKNLNV